MDLGAYVQINDLESLAKVNNINISRIRGYRLMKNEDPIDIAKEKNSYYVIADAISYAIGAHFCISPEFIIYGDSEHKLINKLCDNKNKIIHLELIHGKRRKVIKYYIKQYKKNIEKQYTLFNKYIGRDDVLYIHARLGSSNWSDITHEYYKDQSWYLESIDDTFDQSYCDIYARIDPNTINKEISNEKD